MDAESCIHRVRIEKRLTPSESLHHLRYPVPPKSGRASVKCLVFLLRFEQVTSRIKVGLVHLLNLLARRYVMGYRHYWSAKDQPISATRMNEISLQVLRVP